MDPNKIGKFIFQLRTENHLSQYQLADKIPISRQAVSKWERGQAIPDSSTLILLSELFNVTINELLNGERIEKNTIKELENTTLKIVDEHNKNTKILRILLRIIIPTIMIIIILFLSYYFINSYNTIKVYVISGTGKEFDIYDGIFITTKQKSYLKIGKIQNRNNHTINSISLYYLKKDKEYFISEDLDIDKTIIYTYGYEDEIIKNQKEFMNNSYIEIIYDDYQLEKIHLVFKRDFINDNYLFIKRNIISEGLVEKKEKEYQYQEEIKYIIENGKKSNNTYFLNIEESNIQFIYYEDINQLMKKEEDNISWTILLDNKIYLCDDKNTTDNSSTECIKKCREELEKYLLPG